MTFCFLLLALDRIRRFQFRAACCRLERYHQEKLGQLSDSEERKLVREIASHRFAIVILEKRLRQCRSDAAKKVAHAEHLLANDPKLRG